MESLPYSTLQSLHGQPMRIDSSESELWSFIRWRVGRFTVTVESLGHLFTVGHGVDIDLLHDVPDLNRNGRRPALLDLDAQDPEVFGLDFGQQAILEDRQDVPVDADNYT